MWADPDNCLPHGSSQAPRQTVEVTVLLKSADLMASVWLLIYLHNDVPHAFWQFCKTGVKQVLGHVEHLVKHLTCCTFVPEGHSLQTICNLAATAAQAEQSRSLAGPCRTLAKVEGI